MRLPASLRSRFLLIVLAGAIVPLAATGYWLTESAVRSAEDLLRSQLESELKSATAKVQERWEVRTADLTYLANNDVAVRALKGVRPHPSVEDSGFMASAYSSFAASFPVVVLRDVHGVVKWRLEEGSLRSPGGTLPRLPPPFADRARVNVAVAALDPARRTVGTLDAEMRIDAVLPRDSLPPLVNGSELSIRDNTTGTILRGGEATGRRSGALEAEENQWLVVERSVPGLPLVFTLAAPSQPFLEPFQRGAGIGLALLIATTAGVLLLSMFFTARLTRSLEVLADSADAISRGNLSLDVPVTSDNSEEVRRLAESFQSMAASLQKTLHDLTRREALAAVGEFAASMSHEVRNGLSSIRLDLQRIDERLSADNSAKQLVNRALRNVQRLTVSVTGALGVARGSSEDWPVFELAPVLEAAADASEEAFVRSGSELRRRLEMGTHCTVRGDAMALEQLFANLLLNAGQASTPGTVATLEMRPLSDDQIEVAVRDCGVGIDAAKLKKVGESFYSSKPGGTGLGLSISAKIAAAHGGDLTIESIPGTGTTVRVRLPASCGLITQV